MAIRGERIELGALLKWAGVVGTGGEAKRMVQEGRVRVNGAVETRRSRAVVPGDVVDAAGVRLVVVAEV
ncbi:MAG: RNA-binding S4 domain-containing protein [Armatimonadota bacterium]|nr:RNA-binding S4 domain-containing protein [Armatimonadota bacterium]